MFKAAGPAEIVRSHQKDDFYLGYLRKTAAEVVHALIGPRGWIKWRKEVDLIADIGYFLLTTVSGYQTIGEEYVNIIQVDSSQRWVPSVFQRGILVCLHVLMPYCLQKLFDLLEKKLRSHDSQVPMETREFLLQCIPILRKSVIYVHRVHLTFFYLRGIFYHIAKRTAAIRYIQYSYDRGIDDSSVAQSFKFLGWLTMSQLIGSSLMLGYKFLKDKAYFLGTDSKISQESEESTGYVPSKRKCSLCLEVRKYSTVTPCGHLFCWFCIHDWCQKKPECPLCREKFEQHRLVQLQNLDPPD